MTAEDALGAHVAGWPAFALDVILRKTADPYLRAMSAEQRAQLERTHREIHAAAVHWRSTSVASVISPAEAPAAMIASGLTGDQLTTADAALILGVSSRRIRQLAERWADDGMACRTGRTRSIDSRAVLDRRDTAA